MPHCKNQILFVFLIVVRVQYRATIMASLLKCKTSLELNRTVAIKMIYKVNPCPTTENRNFLLSSSFSELTRSVFLCYVNSFSFLLRLKTAESRTEYGEMNITKLNHRSIFRIAKCQIPNSEMILAESTTSRMRL